MTFVYLLMPSKIHSLLVSACFCFILFAQAQTAQLIEKAESYHSTSYEMADSIYSTVLSDTLNNTLSYRYHISKGKLNMYWGLFDQALEEIEIAIQKSKVIKNDTLEVKALALKADVLLDKGMIEESVQLYLETIKKMETKENTVLLSFLYGSLAEIYRITDQLDYALDFNNKALQTAIHSNNEHSWARLYNNLSATLGEAGENERAIDTLKKALSMISDSNYFAEAKYYSNIGYSFRNMAIYDSALYYHKKSLDLKLEHQFSNTVWYSYNAIGRAFLGLNQEDSALYYLKRGFEYARQFGNMYHLKDAHIHLSSAYAANKNYENAYHYLKQGKTLEDSIYETDQETKINLYQKKFDVAKKEDELKRIKLNALLEKEQVKSKQFALIGLLMLFILLAIIFALLSKRRAQQKQIVELNLERSKKALLQNKQRLQEFAVELSSKNQKLLDLNQELVLMTEALGKKEDISASQKEKLANLKILTDSDWSKFKALFERVYPGFFDQLRGHTIEFTKGEKRIMALIKLNLNNQEAANLLGISAESVSKSKSRLKKKLEQEKYSSIQGFIDQF